MDRPDDFTSYADNGGPSAWSRNPLLAKHVRSRVVYSADRAEEGLRYVQATGAGREQVAAATALKLAVSMLNSIVEDIDKELGKPQASA